MKYVVRVLAVLGIIVVTVTLTASLLRSKLRPVVTPSGTATIGGPFNLAATNGQNVSDQTYRGRWVLMYFGYTHCPDACPAALNNISVALEKLGGEANTLQPLYVSVDPARDTREVMSDYLKPFDPRIVGLTGTRSQIDDVIKEFHVYVSPMKSDGDDDKHLLAHSAYIYLFDPQGTFIDVIQGGATGDEIAAWLRKEKGTGS